MSAKSAKNKAVFEKEQNVVNTIQYNTIQYNAIQCNAMQYNAMQCNTIQYNAMQCNTIQYNAMQCNAMQYNTMQCNAIQYNTMRFHYASHTHRSREELRPSLMYLRQVKSEISPRLLYWKRWRYYRPGRGTKNPRSTDVFPGKSLLHIYSAVAILL